MKLIFYGGGDASDNLTVDQKLMKLVGKEKIQMTLIPADSYESEVDFKAFIKQYRKHGATRFIHFPIDLPFDPVLLEEVFKSDVIHLGGGNTFYFLYHLKKSGIDKRLKNFVQMGGILTGLSAGAIIMTPTITTASFPSFDCDENEIKLKNLRALDLVPFEFFPHFRNSKRYKDAMVSYAKKIKHPLYCAPDGAAVIYCDGNIEVIGKVLKL